MLTPEKLNSIALPTEYPLAKPSVMVIYLLEEIVIVEEDEIVLIAVKVLPLAIESWEGNIIWRIAESSKLSAGMNEKVYT